MKTFSAKASEVPRKWWVIDASDQALGKLAVKAANLLRGKAGSPLQAARDFAINASRIGSVSAHRVARIFCALSYADLGEADLRFSVTRANSHRLE